jgi:hypothetical protein
MMWVMKLATICGTLLLASPGLAQDGMVTAQSGDSNMKVEMVCEFSAMQCCFMEYMTKS